MEFSHIFNIFENSKKQFKQIDQTKTIADEEFTIKKVGYVFIMNRNP